MHLRKRSFGFFSEHALYPWLSKTGIRGKSNRHTCFHVAKHDANQSTTIDAINPIYISEKREKAKSHHTRTFALFDLFFHCAVKKALLINIRALSIFNLILLTAVVITLPST